MNCAYKVWKLIEMSGFDRLFEESLGAAGVFQWSVFAMTWPFELATAFPIILHIFTTFIPDHR